MTSPRASGSSWVLLAEAPAGCDRSHTILKGAINNETLFSLSAIACALRFVVGKANARLLGYIRVSSQLQSEEGVSLDAQRTKLRAYATALDLELVDIVEDAGLSAKSLARPGLQNVLSRLVDGEATGILVVKLDRLTRSVRDLGDLVEKYFGARFSLLSVNDNIDTRTASGRLVLNVLTSVAQWEREATGERTRDALAHLRTQGVRLGGAALGWKRALHTDDEGRRCIELDEREGRTVGRILDLHGQGLSLRDIARTLSEEGYPSKRGGRWAPETVRKVIARHRLSVAEERQRPLAR
ncbi:MAG: recombinase family protein [Polyangiaceae bacterium]